MAHSRQASTSASARLQNDSVRPRNLAHDGVYDKPRLRQLVTILVRNLQREPAEEMLRDLVYATPSSPLAGPSCSPHRPVARRTASTTSINSTSTGATVRRSSSGKTYRTRRRSSVASYIMKEEGSAQEGEKGIRARRPSQREGEGSLSEAIHVTWDTATLRKLLEERASESFVSLSFPLDLETKGGRIYATPNSMSSGPNHAWGRAFWSHHSQYRIDPVWEFEREAWEAHDVGSLTRVKVHLWSRKASEKGKEREGWQPGAAIETGREIAEGWTQIWEREVDLESLQSVQAEHLGAWSNELGKDVVLLGISSPLSQLMRTQEEHQISSSQEEAKSSTPEFKERRGRGVHQPDVRFYKVEGPSPPDVAQENEKKMSGAGMKAGKLLDVRRMLKEGTLSHSYDVAQVVQILQLQKQLYSAAIELRERRMSLGELAGNEYGSIARRLSRNGEVGRIKRMTEEKDDERETAKDERRLLESKREGINRRRVRLDMARRLQHAEGKAIKDSRANLGSLFSLSEARGLKMHSRRVALLQLLEFIYPIDLVDGSLLLFSIAGIPLSNRREDVEDDKTSYKHEEDDDKVSSALCLAAQLVTLLSNYLDTPVPYPVAIAGSRSVIYDPIAMIASPRNFPLYAKNVENYRFRYAVFLLNKDIEHLMNTHGVTMLDRGHTLPNLKNLLVTLSSSRAPVSRLPTKAKVSQRTISLSSSEPKQMSSTSNSASKLGIGHPSTDQVSSNGNDGNRPDGAQIGSAEKRDPLPNAWSMGMSLLWGTGASKKVKQQQHQHQINDGLQEQQRQDATAGIPTLRSLGSRSS